VQRGGRAAADTTHVAFARKARDPVDNLRIAQAGFPAAPRVLVAENIFGSRFPTAMDC